MNLTDEDRKYIIEGLSKNSNLNNFATIAFMLHDIKRDIRFVKYSMFYYSFIVSIICAYCIMMY